MSYDTRNDGSSSATRQELRPDHNMNITARNEQGQFVSLNKDRQLDNMKDHRDEVSRKENKENTYENKPPYEKSYEKFDKTANGDMSNMLRHIEQLERRLQQRDGELTDAKSRVEKFSQRTREGMQSALDSLMKKWMDAVETKDDNCKTEFKKGMERLVQNSAEDNGVWQMMVEASALHEKQEHNLDQLRLQNDELKQKIDGHYATPASRTDNALGKRKADDEMDRSDVGAETTASIWDEFAKECQAF